MYYVYILKCADTSLYTGIATNVERRVTEHNEAKTGAKYTRSRRPVKLMYQKKFTDRSSALKAEAALKKLSRAEKLSIIKLQK